jgi:hypothetical protein
VSFAAITLCVASQRVFVVVVVVYSVIDTVRKLFDTPSYMSILKFISKVVARGACVTHNHKEYAHYSNA